MLRLMMASGIARRDADKLSAAAENAARHLEDVQEADERLRDQGRSGAFEDLRKQLGLDPEAETRPTTLTLTVGGRKMNRVPVHATMDDDDEVPG